MKDERNPLKVLAKEAVWYQDELDKESLRGWERESVKEQYDKHFMKVIKGNYSVDLFIQYMNEYKTLSIPEYYEWIKK
ncbi:hypothetical protein [Bacillus nitratireducens]|uniref:hypothetical protein n=1 Tax=Bacillus nitratireducens TaxID=2026193 RepID=UPI0011A1E863|nr:hypothetical protein [Bacillus nitratireducens]